ncbi:MAG: hypothetical protein ACRER2_01705 [Methylococcales bacterium]
MKTGIPFTQPALHVFTQASNRRHHRSGYLFQGRFKAILVDRDGYYLLQLTRDVVASALGPGLAVGGYLKRILFIQCGTLFIDPGFNDRDLFGAPDADRGAR